MNGRQLTIWDNVALEKGLGCLSSMELDAAIEYLSDCLESGTVNRDKIVRFIDISRHWKERIFLREGNRVSDEFIRELISEISVFEFPHEMGGLKKSLMTYLAGLAPRIRDISFESIEALFDQLLEEKEYEKADQLVQGHYQNDPGNKMLLYLMAQAKWFMHEHAEANRIYAVALLTSPENLPLLRIENPKLRELIIAVGASMAPAYGWIANILPFVPIETLAAFSIPEETQAMQCYRLLQESQRALKRNDMPACINYRKQLKSLAPELYEAYFNLLKSRKTGDSVSMDPFPVQGD